MSSSITLSCSITLSSSISVTGNQVELDNLERARLTLIELDDSFTLSPRSSSLPSSMVGELDREVELDYWWSTMDEDRARVDFELGVNISSTVSRGRLSIELGWLIELDKLVSSSVAHITNMIQSSVRYVIRSWITWYKMYNNSIQELG